MKWNIFSQPIGSAQPIGSIKKEMPIPLAVPLALGAASAISSIWGGSESAKAAEEQRRMIEQQRNALEAERLRKTNENYIDTAAGQNLIRKAKEVADENWRKAAGAAAVGGSTDAAAQMAKDAGNKMVGDTIADIAAQDTARKDNIDTSYRADISRLDGQLANIQGARAGAIAQAAGGAANALGSLAMSTFGGTKLGQSWFGTQGNGSPAGGGVTPISGYGDPSRLLAQNYTNYSYMPTNLLANYYG